MSFGQQLQTARKNSGLTQKQLGEAVEASKSTITSWETGARQPDIPMIKRLTQVLNVSAEYLLEIEKAPANAEAIHIDNTMKKYAQLDEFGKRAVAAVTDVEYERCQMSRVRKVTTVSGAMRVIPYSNLAASAGLGEWLDSENMDELEIPDVPGNRNADFAVPVSGDSMMPTYRDGDILLIHEQDAVNAGDIGLFAINGNGFVKEMGDGELISHNSEYENIPINESFRCFGKVIGKL